MNETATAAGRWRIWRWIGIALLTPLAILLAYALAGMVGGLIPANRDWREPAAGIRVYVEDNGIHTGIVVPVRAAGIDWDELVDGSDLRDPRHGGHGWRSFGWGERDFYLNTARWSDLSLRRVIVAGMGSDRTLMHVDFLPEPVEGRDVRSIVLRPDEYRRLVRFIRASFRAAPGTRAAAYPGYGANDAFYPATGRYSAGRTCNDWTGAAFRSAGVKMGIWTPFPTNVMRWL